MKIFAYGYRCTKADLEPLGAGERIYLDGDPERQARRQMMQELGPSCVVRVLYLRHLGGSPKADAIWRERIERKGARVEVHRPAEHPSRKAAHRPRSKFDPTPEQRAEIEDIWLDPTRSLADRLSAVRAVLGSQVSRQLLYYHIGKP